MQRGFGCGSELFFQFSGQNLVLSSSACDTTSKIQIARKVLNERRLKTPPTNEGLGAVGCSSCLAGWRVVYVRNVRGSVSICKAQIVQTLFVRTPSEVRRSRLLCWCTCHVYTLTESADQCKYYICTIVHVSFPRISTRVVTAWL